MRSHPVTGLLITSQQMSTDFTLRACRFVTSCKWWISLTFCGESKQNRIYIFFRLRHFFTNLELSVSSISNVHNVKMVESSKIHCKVLLNVVFNRLSVENILSCLRCIYVGYSISSKLFFSKVQLGSSLIDPVLLQEET